ncbi:MAG: hypothetical protein IJ741_06470 [Schwartzia sp.]|nr:hypothetical protein [Schwartzia sp. (in: firmicutes)]
MRFTLDVNEEQAKLIQDALELYIRVRIGQWQEVAEVCMVKNDELSGEEYVAQKNRVRPLLGEARAICFSELGTDLCGSYGVSRFADTRAAYDVFQVIRRELSWARHPKGARTLDFDKTTQFSDLPMPVCKKSKD